MPKNIGTLVSSSELSEWMHEGAREELAYTTRLIERYIQKLEQRKNAELKKNIV